MKQKELKLVAEEIAKKILNSKTTGEYSNDPYQHLVIDNFLPADLADECLVNYPADDSDEWQRSNDEDIEIKGRTNWQSEFDIPEGIVDAIRLMNSSPILKAMAEVLDIPKIMPDPYFSGGGLNITQRGGLLDIHVDGNYHDASGLNRRINALIYFNQGWQDSWGGEFGLYDEKGENLIKAVAPLYNRLVIFETHDYSYHGLPNPLNFPENDSRKSIILYYYTKENRPSEHVVVDEPHSALWKKRNYMDKRGNKTRDFD